MSYHKDTKQGSNDSIYSVSEPIQEARPSMEGYDPNRIPLSIFTSKQSTSTTQEWSLASNESLFSITQRKSFESNFLCCYKNSTTIYSLSQEEFHEIKFNSRSFLDSSEPTIQAKFFHPNNSTTAHENDDEDKTSTQEREDEAASVDRTVITCSNSMQRNQEDAKKHSPETKITAYKKVREEERARTRVVNEFSEDKASSVDKTTGSVSMQRNQEYAKKHGPETKITAYDKVRKEERARTRVVNEFSEDQASSVDKTTGSVLMQGNQVLRTSYAFNRSEDKYRLLNKPPRPKEIEIKEDGQPNKVYQAPNSPSSGLFSCFNICFSGKSVCGGGL